MLLFAACPPRAALTQTWSPTSANQAITERWWLTAWSPVAPIADLTRLPPSAPQLLDLLVAPAPRVGLAWSAGTPAALGDEVTDAWVGLAAARTHEAGDYRRPLDPDALRATWFEGLGWGPIGTKGAVVGRVVIAQLDLDPAARSDVASPYASNPFVASDTTVPALSRVAAQLEGGIGGRFGSWAAGLSLGAMVGDDHTRNSGFPRLVKRSIPGVAAGLSRALGFLDMRLAVYGRWMGGDETIILPGQPAPGTVYVLDGYSEPDPRAVTPQSLFFYRADRSAWSEGLAATGRVARVAWTLYAERARRTDEQVSARRLHAPTDRWHATGVTYGLAAQWLLPRHDLYVTAEWRLDRLRGDATRADLTGIIYRATESASHFAADVRYLPPSRWAVAATLAILRENRLRQDFIAERYSELRAWTPGIGLEVARSFGVNAVSLGYAVSAYSPSGGIPDPSTMGPIYQQLIAPEQSLYATSVRPSRAAFTVRRRFPSGTAALLRVSRESVGGSREPLAAGALPYAPTGSRTRWDVSLGVVLGQ
jgi:hypothetical protein